MAIDLSLLAHGDLFEAAFDVDGLRVEVLAEVEISGTALHLRDIAIYPAGVGRPVGLPSLLGSLAPSCSQAHAAPASRRSRSPDSPDGQQSRAYRELTIDLSRDPG